MVKITLAEDHIYQGVIYLKGEQDVPDEMAESLKKKKEGAKVGQASGPRIVQPGHAIGVADESLPDDSLPEDFPARDKLAEAEITSRSQLAAMSDEDLTAIKGIGQATAQQIREAEASLKD